MSEPNQKPQGSDRRAWVRFPSTPETPFFTLAEAEEIIFRKAKVRDISKGGVGLILNQEFPVGTMIDLVLPDPETEQSYTLQAQVIRADAQAGGGWFLGCTFHRELHDEQFRILKAAAALTE